MRAPRTGREWAIVLAGGDGTRLSELTLGPTGRAVPKQYWSLRGGRTLLGDAIARAARIVPRERILVVVARAHEEHWRGELSALPRRNAIVQPSNRGTAAGALLPTFVVLERDPDATILLLPSDHHVAGEGVLERALRAALELASRDGAVLVGLEPDSPEPQYGWILPEEDGAFPRVRSFVEKPPPELAAELMSRGALWNGFFLAARGRSIVELVADRVPGLAPALWQASRPGASPELLERVYEELPVADFSRDVLQGSERKLRLVRAGPCGWTDLGDPRRVVDCLESLRTRARPTTPGPGPLHVLEDAVRRDPHRRSFGASA